MIDNKKFKVIGLIPSRLNSTRLFNKALLELDGFPLVIHTYKRAQLSKYLDDIYICTDSKKIMKIAKDNKCKVILTGKNNTGTDRISEASLKLKKKYDLFIDIQGDEPLLNPNHIDRVITWHQKNLEFDIVVPSLVSKGIDTPNIVKIVKSKKRVIYFSRARVPFAFKKISNNYLKHLSIISFKPEALINFRKFKQGILEKQEGIELMRAIENNMKVGTFKLEGDSFSVDTKEDFSKAQKRIIHDKTRKKY